MVVKAVAALYTFKQPGIYAYLNHNLIEAFMLGGAAHVSVKGKMEQRFNGASCETWSY